MPEEVTPQNDQVPWTRRAAAPWVALFFLLLFHLCANLWWLAVDNHVIRTDEETHMFVARNYYEAMFGDTGHPRTLFERIVDTAKIKLSNPAHPPLLHIAGAVMIRLFGYSVDHMASVNTLMFLLALLGCFLIARRALPPWHAVFVTFVVSFTPIIFVSSRYFMTDYLSMTLTIWAVYALIRSDRFLNTRWVFVFALLNGLGILARTNTFLYYLIPCAAVVLSGLWPILRANNQRRPDLQLLRRWSFNVVLCGVVTVAVFGPWYFRHLDRFYTYWTEEHLMADKGLITLASSDETPPPKTDSVNVSQEKEPAPAPTGKSAESKPFYAALLHPKTPWRRYPFYAVNDGMFLVLFILSLIGIPLALRRKVLPPGIWWPLILWPIGSWFFLTVLFTISNARYALQAVPALSIFAAIPLLQIRNPRFKRFAIIGLAVLLAFQYGNLTFHTYGRVANLYLPCTADSGTQRAFREMGLYVCKENLALGGGSYVRLGAPEKENYKDRIFFAMLRAEKERPYRQGISASYISLNMRGMGFDQQHFWPDVPKKNPYRLRNLPPEWIPDRCLRGIAWGRSPEDIAPFLPNAEYVVYAIDAGKTEREQQWQDFLKQNHFDMIDWFQEDQMGPIPAQDYAVFAKRYEGKLISIQSESDLDQLSLYDLYAFTRSSEFGKASASLQLYAKNRLNAMAKEMGTPIPINEYVSFIGASALYEQEDWFQFQFIFHVEKAIPADYRVYFHGTPNDTDISFLPENRRELGYIDWNFDPRPITTNWPAGEYVIIKQRIQAALIPYNMKIGFFSRAAGFWGKSIKLGWVDLAKIAAEKKPPAGDSAPETPQTAAPPPAGDSAQETPQTAAP